MTQTHFDRVANRLNLSNESRGHLLSVLTELGLTPDDPVVLCLLWTGTALDVAAKVPQEIREAGDQAAGQIANFITENGNRSAQQIYDHGLAAVQEMARQIEAVRQAGKTVRDAAKADIAQTVAASVKDFLDQSQDAILRTQNFKWFSIAVVVLLLGGGVEWLFAYQKGTEYGVSLARLEAQEEVYKTQLALGDGAKWATTITSPAQKERALWAARLNEREFRLAQWAQTSEGRIARQMADDGTLGHILRCDRPGWSSERGNNGEALCIPERANDGQIWGWPRYN